MNSRLETRGTGSRDTDCKTWTKLAPRLGLSLRGICGYLEVEVDCKIMGLQAMAPEAMMILTTFFLYFFSLFLLIILLTTRLLSNILMDKLFSQKCTYIRFLFWNQNLHLSANKFLDYLISTSRSWLISLILPTNSAFRKIKFCQTYLIAHSKMIIISFKV